METHFQETVGKQFLGMVVHVCRSGFVKLMNCSRFNDKPFEKSRQTSKTCIFFDLFQSSTPPPRQALGRSFGSRGLGRSSRKKKILPLRTALPQTVLWLQSRVLQQKWNPTVFDCLHGGSTEA